MSDFTTTTIGICRSGQDITFRQVALLLLCLRHDAEPPARQVAALAAELRIPKASVTRATDRMVLFGYASRAVPKEDRRRCVVSITPKGRKFLSFVEGGGA